MRTLLASLALSGLLLAACRTDVPASDASNVTPPASSTTTTTTTTPITSANPAEDAGTAPPPVADTTPPAQFTSCKADADCVAVPRVGCCHPGWNEAVNKAQADAYQKSFTCPQTNPICPMIKVRDDRKAVCDHGSCKMTK